jgi:DNA-binding NarL/FixJ family response regulator
MTRVLGACSRDGRAVALKLARVQLARRTWVERSRSNGRWSHDLTVLDGGASDELRPARTCLPISVVVAQSVGLVRAGLHSLLEEAHDITVAGAASSGEEAVALASETRPDVVLMDIRLPGLGGLATMRRILTDSKLSQVRVVILTPDEREEDLFGALRSGASGFVLLDTEPVELLRAVRVVASGDAQLSPWATRRLLEEFASIPDLPGSYPEQFEELTARERDIVSLVATGLTNGEIAQRLVLSPATVKTHVSRAMLKLHARDRAKLVALAYQTGFVRHHRAVNPSAEPDRSALRLAATQQG